MLVTKLNFYLADKKVNPPKNWQEFGIELNRTPDNIGQAVTLTDFEFVLENADIINQWIKDNLIFEGVPLRIEIERLGVTERVFNGYLDLKQTSKFSKDRIEVKAIERDSIDFVNDKADAFTFAYLKDKGIINSSDFDSIPYILNSVPNYTESALSILAVYVMVREIKSAIQRLYDFVVELPVYYVFSTYVKLILYIVYLIALIIALIKLVKQVIMLIIQPVKYHACMSVKKHFEKGCEQLGLTFESDIFDSAPYKDAYILPSKYYNKINSKDKELFGFTEPSNEQEGFHKVTFGEFLRDMKAIYNAKIVVRNGVLKFVRRDYKNPSSTYVLPPVYQPYYSYNTNEFNANTYIKFQVDTLDKNTIQEFKGTSYQLILEPNRVLDAQNSLMSGINEISINFALAKRKNDLTVPEKILNEFLKVFDVIAGALVKVINAVITVLNKIIAIVNDILKKLSTIGIKVKFVLPSIPTVSMPKFSTIFENRKGMLKIENDNTGLQKIFIMTKGSSAKYNKIHELNDTYFSAKYLYDNFYYIDSFMPSDEFPNGNQYLIKNFDNVPFSFDDYEKIKENSSIFTSDGKEADYDVIKWNIFRQTADVEFRINELYTNNLKATYLEPDGK